MTIGEVVAARREAFYAALESGEFAQGRTTLEAVAPNGGVTSCCLGVGMRVAMAGGLPMLTAAMGNVTLFHTRRALNSYGYPIDYVDGLLHQDAAEWYRFDHTDPLIQWTLDGRRIVSATECNDRQRLSFTAIAALFRAAYPADPDSEV